MNVAVSGRGKAGLWISFWLLLIVLYSPILILIIFSFNDREIVSFPWEGFTFRWYESFVQNEEIIEAIRVSGQIALVASICTTALAIPASIALARRRFVAKGAISGVLLAPLVIPLVVLGTSLLILFNMVGLPFGFLTIVIAHIVIAIPFAVLTIVPRLERIPVALEEASRDLGATWFVTFRTITLPLLTPAIISAFLISFTISFDEIVLADFVGGQVTTFPRYVWGQLRLPRQLPQVIAVAVVVLVISTIVIALSEVIRRRADRHLEESTQVFDDDGTIDATSPSLTSGVIT